MNLTNMKQDQKDGPTNGEDSFLSDPQDVPAYPYGLKVCLDDESLGKLNLSNLPKAGDAFLLLAKVEVSSVAEYRKMDGGFEQRVELQITDMALEKPAPKKSMESMIYGNA